TALIQTSGPGAGTRRGDLYVGGLSLGLGIACLIALVIVWKTWVIVPAERLARAAPSPWTHKVGLVLAVLWPLQCGFGLAVSGPVVLLFDRRPAARERPGRRGALRPKRHRPFDRDFDALPAGTEPPGRYTWAEMAWLAIGGYWIGMTVLMTSVRLDGTV